LIQISSENWCISVREDSPFILNFLNHDQYTLMIMIN
jgi:hypothetical protein